MSTTPLERLTRIDTTSLVDAGVALSEPPAHLTSSGFPSAVFFEYHWSIGKHIRCGVAGFCIRNDHSP